MEVGKFVHFGPGLEGFGKIVRVEKENDLFVILDYAEDGKIRKKISSQIMR